MFQRERLVTLKRENEFVVFLCSVIKNEMIESGFNFFGFRTKVGNFSPVVEIDEEVCAEGDENLDDFEEVFSSRDLFAAECKRSKKVE
jgi:hypothetical protein